MGGSGRVGVGAEIPVVYTVCHSQCQGDLAFRVSSVDLKVFQRSLVLSKTVG